jgi:hypothetical protein
MYSSNKRLTGMALTPTIFGHERRVCPVVLRDTGQCNEGKDVTSGSTSHIRQTMCDAAQDRQCGLGQELALDLGLLPARGTDVLTAFCRPILTTQGEGHQVRCGLSGGVQVIHPDGRRGVRWIVRAGPARQPAEVFRLHISPQPMTLEIRAPVVEPASIPRRLARQCGGTEWLPRT